MKHFFTILFSILFFKSVFAQIPTKCLEIESILVDACGAPEYNNEMVRLKIGPSPISVSSIVAVWPTSTFQGMKPAFNATNVSVVAAINASITSCGKLLEPPGGIIPAGAKVIFFTSNTVNPTANSFANLSDTLYAIFQNTQPTNIGGHFVNYNSSPGLRTIIIGTSPLSACSDTVIYERSNLITQSGAIGQEDGAAVNFSWNGTATYINDACTAPIIPFSIAVSSNPTTSCAGNSLSVNVVISGGTYNSINWSAPSAAGSFSAPLGTNVIFNISPTTILSGAYLTADVVDKCGVHYKDSVQITILHSPIVTNTSNSATTFCQGGSVTLSAGLTSGITPVTYLWNDLASSTSTSISVNTSGTYHFTATNTCGSTISSDIVVTVSPLPISNAGRDTTICSGSFLVIGADSVADCTYTWTNGSNLSNATISNPQVIFNNSGVVVSTQTFAITSVLNGCTSLDSVTVDISPLPIGNPSQVITICPGASANIGVTAQITGYTYSWTPTTNVTNPSLAQTTVSPVSDTTRYVLNTVAFGGCENRDTVVVIIANSLTVDAGAGDSICAGNGTLLQALSGASGYSWTPTIGLSNSLVANPIATPASTTTYYVTATSGNCQAIDSVTVLVNTPITPIVSSSGTVNLCQGESVTLMSSSSTGNTWSDGSINSSITVSVAGNYFVTVVDANGCSGNSSSVIVTVNSLPIANAGSDVAFCSGSNGNIGINVTGNNYVWTPSTDLSSASIANPTVNSINLGTGTIINQYILTVSNGTCSNSDTVQVTVNPLPVVDAGSDLAICNNAVANIGVAGLSGVSYSWSPSLGLANSASSSTTLTGVNTNFTPITLSYTLTAINQSTNCVNSDVVNVIVNPVPSIGITSSATSICQGGTVILNANTLSSGNVLWSSSQTGNSISVGTAGTYTATITDACGTATSNSIVINVEQVDAAFTPSATFGDAPLVVNFENTSTLNENYGWNFGNNNISNTFVPNGQTYTSEGVYTVVLTVTTVLGCTDTAMVIITVTELPLVFQVPNVFTPNADNTNDFLKVKTDSLAEFDMKVYDRWGLFMYESTDYKIGWDGRTPNGSDAADGVYYYLVNYRFAKRKQSESKQGSFSLIR